MTASSHVNFKYGNQALFSADSTCVSHADVRVPLDEVTLWSLLANKVTTNGVKDWFVRFMVFDADTDNAPREVLSHGRRFPPRLSARVSDWSSVRDSWALDALYKEVLNFAVTHISPKVAERWIHDVLDGGTCRVSNELSISRDGLTRKEGAIFKKDVTYPWRDYQGFKEESEVHLQADAKTAKVQVHSKVSQPGTTHFYNYGVAPIVLDYLAHKFGT
jgi:hypothetical protein